MNPFRYCEGWEEETGRREALPRVSQDLPSREILKPEKDLFITMASGASECSWN